MTIKRHLKNFAKWGFTNFKIYTLARDPLKILMYHRFRADHDPGYVLTQGEFETHLRFIREHFTVVDLGIYLEQGVKTKHRKPPLAITTDDGYRNFYEYAYPLLKKYDLPATVYIPYNFIESGGWLWQDKNIFAIRNTKKVHFMFEFEGERMEGTTRPREKLFEALLEIYRMCASLPFDLKAELSEKLASELEVDLSLGPDREFRPMTWEMVRELESNGIAIGSHTMNHTILTETSASEANYEVGESKAALESRLCHPVCGFCYPNGNFNQQIQDMVQTVGYHYAVTTVPGNNRDCKNPYELRRFGPAPSPLYQFVYSIHSFRR